MVEGTARMQMSVAIMSKNPIWMVRPGTSQPKGNVRMKTVIPMLEENKKDGSGDSKPRVCSHKPTCGQIETW